MYPVSNSLMPASISGVNLWASSDGGGGDTAAGGALPGGPRAGGGSGNHIRGIYPGMREDSDKEAVVILSIRIVNIFQKHFIAGCQVVNYTGCELHMLASPWWTNT